MARRERLRRALILASRQFERIGRGLLYVAVGTARLDDLRTEIKRTFDLNDAGKPEAFVRSGFLSWELEVVSQCVRPSDHVLVVGSGTGRDVLAFLEMGCRVTAVEPSAAATEIANAVLAKRGFSVPTVHGFFEDAPLEGPFDVVAFLFFCYSCIPDSRRRIDALRKAARLLAPDGRVLVSASRRWEPVSNRMIKVAQAVAGLCRTDWRIEQGDEFIPTIGDVFRYVHIFQPGEFEGEAAAAGLQVTVQNRDGVLFALTSVSTVH